MQPIPCFEHSSDNSLIRVSLNFTYGHVLHEKITNIPLDVLEVFKETSLPLTSFIFSSAIGIGAFNPSSVPADVLINDSRNPQATNSTKNIKPFFMIIDLITY